MGDFELAWDARCTIGESPVWDAAARALWFTDIQARRINRLGADGRRDSFVLPDLVPSLGLCRSGRLIVALRNRVALFDPRTGRLHRLTAPIPMARTTRLNDGMVGPDGCFWIGGMDQRPRPEPVARLYRITPDGRVECKLDGLMIANGLAWSPDGGTMYLADTWQNWIDAFEFDRATGRLGQRRRLAILGQGGRAGPDGAAVDAEGCYWTADVFGAAICRLSPQGALLQRTPTPVPAPTMPCLADGMLYFTSLRDGLDPDTLRAHPRSGGLFRTPIATAGQPAIPFAD